MRVFCFILIGFFIALTQPARADAVFFEAIPDMPVARGLIVLPEQGLVYDKPDGQIVKAVALMPLDQGVTRESVVAFYREALPSFGWSALGERRYTRGADRLRFWFEEFEGELYFNLLVSPAAF